VSKDTVSEEPLGLLPGDLSEEARTRRMIRVDHAGEYGAVRIYQGQMSVLGPTAVIAHMAEQEKRHLETFDKLMVQHRVRPTALLPLWHVAGFALGAGSALMGKNAAMACTVAVEEVIDEHYANQVAVVEDDGLKQTFEACRLEELEHRDTALAHGAEQTPGYEGLTAVVKTCSRLAIWLSERI
jgi:ubiquinone biosynthesis monooxygenase Coq7